MKKQLSSLDLHFILKELQVLKDSRIDKIYHPEKSLLIFSLHKANVGKKLLTINIGQSLFLSAGKDEAEDILGFGQLLRKHLNGYFLSEISQIEPERIIKLNFKLKESCKYVYIEFIGKGNAVLCDEHNAIINAFEHHEFRERVVKPKLKYTYPIMNYNLFEINKSQLSELFKKSAKDNVVISMATELGLGGIYSEEVCLLSGIDKGRNPGDISNSEIESILDSIIKIINKRLSAKIVYSGNDVIDAIPFDFEFYKSNEKKEFPAFNEAVSFFYSQFKELKETEFDKKLSSLQRIIEQQRQTIQELKKEEHEFRQKGEAIYQNYALIREILEELNKASKKYSWKEIKEKLKGHKSIKEINEKERKVVVEV